MQIRSLIKVLDNVKFLFRKLHLSSGKDGSRAFVSGDFTEKGLIEDLTGLSHTDILGLEEWSGFYKKDYKHIGMENLECSKNLFQ